MSYLLYGCEQLQTAFLELHTFCHCAGAFGAERAVFALLA